MHQTLLITKTYIPANDDHNIFRHRLMSLLDQGFNRRLTLISAPAGYGKTTLLSNWIAQSAAPFCWLTLDEGDNDLGRFFAYVIASLRSIDIRIDPQFLDFLQPKQNYPLETILIPFINQLVSSSSKDKHFAIVLDDYHLIQNKDIHFAISYLLDHLPTNMHLVIASRADPPLQLARMRARREMNEIRAADLRFSLDESISLFNDVHGLGISREDLETLIWRTEGWIAALQLVAIAVNGKTNVSEYLGGVAGTQAYIAGFLTSEVLNSQPGPIREFLLKTSILERLSGSLCEAVTGEENSLEILMRLRETNLFLVAMDDENHWFRYHQLFSDLLNQRLLETYPDEVNELYRRASRWFQAKGFIDDAIEYALRGNLIQDAAMMIEKQAKTVLSRSEVGTFIRWVKKLPDDLVYNNELLSILFAWALLIVGEENQLAATYLDHLIPSNAQTKGQIDTVRAILAVHQGNIPDAIETATRALENLPADDLFFRQIATWNLSAALFIRRDYEKGAKVLEEVARIGISNKNYLTAIIALCRLGNYYAQAGDLYKAKELFDQALLIASKDSEHPIPVACEAQLGLGKIYWEWNQLEIADRYLSESIENSKSWRQIMALESYIVLAHISQSLADQSRADRTIQEARKLAFQNTATTTDDIFVASQEALLRLRQGNLQAAESWVLEQGLLKRMQEQEISQTPTHGPDIVLRYELLVYCRILLAQNRPSEALKLLNQIIASIEPLGHIQKLIEAYILSAVALRTQKKTPEAQAELQKALTLAQKGGFTRIFLEQGAGLVEILKLCVSSSSSKFAASLLNSFVEIFEKDISTAKNYNLVEPLSDRELEVLRLLNTNMTSNEIADALYIAKSTVRVHIKHIYAKLGVNRRFDAVARAKEIEIL